MTTQPITHGDHVVVTIGHRRMQARFVRWLKGYRAKVIVDGRTWTVGGLAIDREEAK